MMGLMKQRIFNQCGKLIGPIRNRFLRKQFNNSGVSIIASNCVAGTIYHQLKNRFNSPTINCYFENDDFIRFCERLEYYLTVELTDIRQNGGGGIRLDS